jgi:hypothetical protein
VSSSWLSVRRRHGEANRAALLAAGALAPLVQATERAGNELRVTGLELLATLALDDAARPALFDLAAPLLLACVAAPDPAAQLSAARLLALLSLNGTCALLLFRNSADMPAERAAEANREKLAEAIPQLLALLQPTQPASLLVALVDTLDRLSLSRTPCSPDSLPPSLPPCTQFEY